MPSTDAGPSLRTMLKSQYHAALAMLRQAIERCPESLWNDPKHLNPCWQVAYHVLFFAHAYSGQGKTSFVPWSEHQAECQYPDGIPGPNDPASPLPLVAKPYTKAQVLAYWTFCDDRIDGAVDAMDLASPESGFPSYPIPKFEHQLVNLRHIQHHTAQLACRLRDGLGVGIDWAGARRPKPA